MAAVFTLIGRTIVERWRSLILWGAAMALSYQLALMAALILRFGDLPNYVVWYDWPSNVARIIRSTPSYIDMPPIIANEWLIEIGYLNTDFGHGISEWALSVVPFNLALLFIMGAMIGLGLALARSGACETNGARRASGGVSTFGAGLVLLTNATMSWVVCCATPSWVVGLAMLGVGVSTSLALESLGPLLSFGGFGLLLAWIFTLAWLRAKPSARPAPAVNV